jgi:hypothetical protein
LPTTLTLEIAIAPAAIYWLRAFGRIKVELSPHAHGQGGLALSAASDISATAPHFSHSQTHTRLASGGVLGAATIWFPPYSDLGKR